VPSALLLTGAVLCSYCGVGWFALAKEPHWQQALGKPNGKSRNVRALNGLGVVALALSFALCVWVDHVSMASLVWIMMLTASALLVTFTLAWRPRWLALLVVWMR